MSSKVSDSNAAPVFNAEPSFDPIKFPSSNSSFFTSSISPADSAATPGSIAPKETDTDTSSTTASTAKSAFKEMEDVAFEAKFLRAINASTDVFQLSREQSITSFKVGDGITVFGREVGDCIFAYHIPVQAQADEIVYCLREELEEDLEEEDSHRICLLYIIGGDGSEASNTLLEEIYSALKTYFGDKAEIVEELISPNELTAFKYISANIQMNGELTFCRHN